ncbi:MAG: HEPN domain-containing protein [Thermomicrobiales bacterium]
MTERATRDVPTVDAIAARIPRAAARVRPTRTRVAEVAAFIVREFRPERIVLFGSRAYGMPRADSDVDLMVIMETPLKSSEQRRAIRRAIDQRPLAYVDVHVRTPEQIAIGLAERDFFIEDVLLKGITIYAREGLRRSESAEHESSRRAARGTGLKQATLNWLRRADEDARATIILFEGTDEPILNLVCYHAQQCAEKYLKAFLQEREIEFPRTHQLLELAERAAPFVPNLAELKKDLADLTRCIDARYPDIEVDQAQAERAMRTMATVRSSVGAALGLPVTPEH